MIVPLCSKISYPRNVLTYCTKFLASVPGNTYATFHIKYNIEFCCRSLNENKNEIRNYSNGVRYRTNHAKIPHLLVNDSNRTLLFISVSFGGEMTDESQDKIENRTGKTNEKNPVTFDSIW